ncbi:Transcription factor iws1 [Scheffersomyces spartinae]|uniref:Transcription factor IWS1 n=1 Tax=Scheffersomyces spartinae TaxID=45513 RepID=A0A9P7VDQ7_9ASCO|nr:Transcription factor iws1 [Scheffersomyces spartinae]KAG7195935.1 Transcription factor iws1 [Scheffersomyces spartinae]
MSDSEENHLADIFDDEDDVKNLQPEEQADDVNNIYAQATDTFDDRRGTKKNIVRKTQRNDEFGDSSRSNEVDTTRHSGYFDEGNDEMEEDQYANEDPESRKRRLLEEKMDQAMKSKTTRRRKADEDDLERMQDDRIDSLKDKMIRAANVDVEKNSQGQIATEKLKMLKEVMNVLSKADLAISILDNNLLEAVRLWLEPLPDALMPAYQIQMELVQSLTALPIKTDHLVASGIGKVLVFYQRSKRTEPNLKRIVDRLISDWTRPILNKSDSYKDRTIRFHDYNKNKYANQLLSQRKRNKLKESKTLYEESAERRNRAAIPAARTTAYRIAPKVNIDMLAKQRSTGMDERFKKINQKMTMLKVKKSAKKSGPSIEGRNLAGI